MSDSSFLGSLFFCSSLCAHKYRKRLSRLFAVWTWALGERETLWTNEHAQRKRGCQWMRTFVYNWNQTSCFMEYVVLFRHFCMFVCFCWLLLLSLLLFANHALAISVFSLNTVFASFMRLCPHLNSLLFSFSSFLLSRCLSHRSLAGDHWFKYESQHRRSHCFSVWQILAKWGFDYVQL